MLTRRNVWLVGLTIVLLLFVVAIQNAVPDVDEDSNAWAPSRKVSGELDSPVKLRAGTVELSNLRVARSLVDGSLGTFKTSGIWVVVKYTYTASLEAEQMMAKLVTADGVVYNATARLPTLGVSYIIDGDPEIPVTSTLAFEVPKQDLAGSAVTMGAEIGSNIIGDAVWDTEAVVSLQLGRRKADDLVASAPSTLFVKDF